MFFFFFFFFFCSIDYDYLVLANGGNLPVINTVYNIDTTVDSVAPTLTSWNSDADAMQKVRNELGLYIEGVIF